MRHSFVSTAAKISTMMILFGFFSGFAPKMGIAITRLAHRVANAEQTGGMRGEAEALYLVAGN
ncbi:MAG TPA: hypothetical protein V6C72_16960 [Chroococcales cyanobacterium]